MILQVALCAAIALVQPASPAELSDSTSIKLDRAGLRITESVRVAPGVYTLFDPDDQGAIAIVGDDLTVDFQGATLVGARADVEPDGYAGRGIVIRGRNVTIKNANVRGYKVGIFAEDSRGLSISRCDVSGNYRQRLKSTIEREDLSDWLYGHENDENQWLRYGAGIYLSRCPQATVVNCRARNGQNGLCLVRCDRARIADNDMSFMSGWGLALWRSSDCEVFNNKFDWCMRGYSHGIYSRGQDSAGILVYEQCNRNLFAYNSATHGGDGFFLYAGNETLKRTGRGGCNGNVLYKNDFSHAAANGIEATFSDGNIFIKNLLDECTHGVWAGYSYNTIIEDNTIRNCDYGVSIEHGRNNRIAGNAINDTRVGVHLWWDDDTDLLALPFCETHDRCPSTRNTVVANRFERAGTAVRLADDTSSRVASNRTADVDVPVHLVGNVDGLHLALTEAQRKTMKQEARGAVSFEQPAHPSREWQPFDILARQTRLAWRRGEQMAFLSPGARRGRKYIFIDEWGPYDFSDVRVFPSVLRGGPTAAIQLLGADSPFTVTNVTGQVRILPMEGELPARLTVETKGPGIHSFKMDIKAGGRSLHARGALLNAQWQVAFYGWSESDDPRGGAENWGRILASEPLDRITVPAVDFMWYTRLPSDKVPADRFATVATTTVALPKGTWRIQTISDDGVRVFVDDQRVIDNWTWHAATADEATVELEEADHGVRIEHFEIDGFAQLQFFLEPVIP